MIADHETDATIRQIEFELEKAEHGMARRMTPSASGSCAICWSRRASGNCPMHWQQNAEEDWGKR